MTGLSSAARFTVRNAQSLNAQPDLDSVSMDSVIDYGKWATSRAWHGLFLTCEGYRLLEQLM